ncbi:TIGR03619 family F420-dependent LLM class oxidoreductase [Trujillonella humicola]|uniref:TIGR03619 family F420-dependent LLM class oxidoreductase n=1 Tax=Trujillonella humicola TaxID=3383699 RepID=UPI00390637A1
MKIDVQHATADPDWVSEILSAPALTRFARAAEESGYGALGFTDHPAPPAGWVRGGGEGSVDPFSALGFCAAVTSRIQLLTWVLVLGYRNPFLAAHQLASLDLMSGGRVLAGVGTGYIKGEFRALGMDPAARREAFDEAVEVFRAVWSGGEVSRAGAGFEARAVLPQPPPARPGGPPLWVHGNSPWGTERAACWADGWVVAMLPEPAARLIRTVPVTDPVALAAGIDRMRTRTAELGRDPGSVEVVVTGNWPMLDVRRGWEAQRHLDDAAALTELGVDRVVVVVCGDDPGAAEDTVRRFGEDVVAPLTAAGRSPVPAPADPGGRP